MFLLVTITYIRGSYLREAWNSAKNETGTDHVQVIGHDLAMLFSRVGRQEFSEYLACGLWQGTVVPRDDLLRLCPKYIFRQDLCLINPLFIIL